MINLKYPSLYKFIDSHNFLRYSYTKLYEIKERHCWKDLFYNRMGFRA